MFVNNTKKCVYFLFVKYKDCKINMLTGLYGYILSTCGNEGGRTHVQG